MSEANNNNLAVRRESVVIHSVGDLRELARAAVSGGFAPQGLNSPEAALCAMAYGMELGMTPFESLQEIQVIQGTPSLKGRAKKAKVLGSGLLEEERVEWHEDEKGQKTACRVTLKRHGIPEPYVGTFSLADAHRAGLSGKGNWRTYPERMLFWRAWTFAADDGFADVFRGIRTSEEVEDFNDFRGHPRTINVTASDIKTTPAPEPKPLARSDERRQAAINWWGGRGVSEEAILRRFGVSSLEELSDEHLDLLREEAKEALKGPPPKDEEPDEEGLRGVISKLQNALADLGEDVDPDEPALLQSSAALEGLKQRLEYELECARRKEMLK